MSDKQNIIPPQYKGLPSEIVEELWQNPTYIDDAKNRSEGERRERALKEIRRIERERESAGASNMYEFIADSIPIDEKKPLKPESISPIFGGNMFGENDSQTLAGKIIGHEIYNRLVQRISYKSSLSAQEIIQFGKDGLNDFKSYIEQLNLQSKNGGVDVFEFNIDRPAGQTGFHLNGESGHVTRDHLFYFSKTTKMWKNPHEQQVRAYVTVNPAEVRNIQRHFVDLCVKLYEAGIDFTAKATSPNGLEKRTDNLVLYISASDQEKAGQLIKKFLGQRKIGQGHVAAAIPSPEDGLSWALEPSQSDIKLWQNVSGSTERASYNAVVAVKVLPKYLRRLAEAHIKIGNKNEAGIFLAEADRVEAHINS